LPKRKSVVFGVHPTRSMCIYIPLSSRNICINSHPIRENYGLPLY